MNFFYGNESEMFAFYKIPKLLFSERYKDISTDAKLLFGLMLDRMSLSSKSSKWMDLDGRVYIYFPVQDAMNMLNIGNQKAAKLYKELEDYNLIEREQQYFGKSPKIYVCNFMADSSDSECENHTPMCENHMSRHVKITRLTCENHMSNKGMNKTEWNKTEIIPPLPPLRGGTGESPAQSPEPEPPSPGEPERLEKPEPEPEPEPKPERRTKNRNPATSTELTPDEESALLALSPALCCAVRDWFCYKAEIKKPYNTMTGRTRFLNRVIASAQQYGAEAVTAVIDESMANGYQGVTWDRLTRMAANGARDRPEESWAELAARMVQEGKL